MSTSPKKSLEKPNHCKFVDKFDVLVVNFDTFKDKLEIKLVDRDLETLFFALGAVVLVVLGKAWSNWENVTWKLPGCSGKCQYIYQ